jgi:hypothetical protein
LKFRFSFCHDTFEFTKKGEKKRGGRKLGLRPDMDATSTAEYAAMIREAAVAASKALGLKVPDLGDSGEPGAGQIAEAEGPQPPNVVQTALILGSGLGTFAEELECVRSVSYADLPHAPRTTVTGHSGKLVLGRLKSAYSHAEAAGSECSMDVPDDGSDATWVLCVAGRTHSYEGLHMFQLNFMIRVLRALGCSRVIASNASGGFLQGMWAGCLMVSLSLSLSLRVFLSVHASLCFLFSSPPPFSRLCVISSFPAGI